MAGCVQEAAPDLVDDGWRDVRHRITGVLVTTHHNTVCDWNTALEAFDVVRTWSMHVLSNVAKKSKEMKPKNK